MLIDDSGIKRMNDEERRRKLGKNEGRQTGKKGGNWGVNERM